MGRKRTSKAVKFSCSIALAIGAIVMGYTLLVRKGYIFPLALWDEIICEQCTTEVAYHQPPLGAETINSREPIGKLLTDKFNKSCISILVEKSQRRLTVYQDKRPIKSYPIVLGEKPKGDKYSEGDRHTPQGILYIKDLYPHAEWSKFLWLDYPNAASWRKHFSEKQSGRLPWHKSIGRDAEK
jgi:L,D-transpeptidase catalytic domain